MNKTFVHKLAVERCRVHVSHLCALIHLSGAPIDDDDYLRQSLQGLFENLNRDIGLIENILID